MRLRWRLVEVVKVRFCAVQNRAGSNHNDRGAKGTQEEGRKLDRTTDSPPLGVPARAVPQRSWTSPEGWDDTGGTAGDLGDPAQSVLSLAETPSTGKPDAGNPPVRFGGRGDAHAPSLPLSLPLVGLIMGETRPASLFPKKCTGQ